MSDVGRSQSLAVFDRQNSAQGHIAKRLTRSQSITVLDRETSA
jgi:hypothetical protein